MSRVFVFVGPTLAPGEAALHTMANILPPAQMGDVHDVVTRLQARAIGLIDGLFNTVPSVWHKEILFALSRGVRVFGAASMGALRAAELHTFGMEGIGAIFRSFVAGDLVDDDEVAVAHGDAQIGYRPLSEALVNLRYGLERAEEFGAISGATHARLLARAKAMFYAERSWAALFRAGAELGVPDEELSLLRAFIARVRPNRKRDDAIELLRVMCSAGGEAISPHTPSFTFEATSFWEGMVAATTRHEDEAPRHEAIAQHALLVRGGEERRRGALLFALVEAEAQRLGLVAGESELAAAAERFRRARGLVGREAVLGWLKSQGMEIADLHAMIRAEALVEAVARVHAGGLRSQVVTELQRRAEFGRMCEELARTPRDASWSDSGLSREELLGWYEREVGWLGRDLLRAAQVLGFSTIDELLTALARVHGASR